MNTTLSVGKMLIRDLIDKMPASQNAEVIIAPPFTHLSMALENAAGSAIIIAAQNCYFEEKGAYTGEISVSMLQEMGVRHCIIGHSERRQLFGESDEMIRRKVDALLSYECTPIFCCGEPLEIREANNQVKFVSDQVRAGLFHLDNLTIRKVVIAYEPIWAIGTGRTATPEQAQEMHKEIRQLVARHFDDETANSIRILYGGSVNAENAKTLFDQPDVDGGLVGGASLDPVGFSKIIEAAC